MSFIGGMLDWINEKLNPPYRGSEQERKDAKRLLNPEGCTCDCKVVEADLLVYGNHFCKNGKRLNPRVVYFDKKGRIHVHYKPVRIPGETRYISMKRNLEKKRVRK